MPEPTVILGELAEDFTAKVRNGHSPDIESYATQHPELADRIRELFPALMLLEGLAATPTGATVDEHVTDPTTTLPPGTIFGQYRIEREIARGGMGIVYEAEHLMLHRQVALKILPMAGPQAAKQLERFLREAKTAAGLHHTNIVPVFDVGQVRGVPYYAMQYINGQSLDLVIRAAHDSKRPADQPLTSCAAPANHYRYVADIGIQAAAGLAHAHQRGVIHRDIKPSNLLLDDRGVVWITDFGLARRHDDVSLTHSGQLLGTPRYMSPEQAAAASQPLDHRTDIYSLGATLYELLTGRPAFDGATPLDVVKQIIAREPIRPRQLDQHVPRDLETVVLKAMAKRPEDRYPTAQALADDLQRFTNGEPIQARRINIVGRTWRWVKREPVVAGLVGAVVVVLFFGILSTGWYAHIATRKTEELWLLLNDAAYGIGRRQDDEGFVFRAPLWYAEPLKREDLPVMDEMEVRRRLKIYYRYLDNQSETVLLNRPLDLDITEQWYAYGTDRKEYLLGRKPPASMAIGLFDGLGPSRILDLNLRTGELSVQEGGVIEKFSKEYDTTPIGSVVHRATVNVNRGPIYWTLQHPRNERRYNSWARNTFFMDDPIRKRYPASFAARFESSSMLIERSKNTLFQEILVEVCERRYPALRCSVFCYDIEPNQVSKQQLLRFAEVFACCRLDRGTAIPLTIREVQDRWTSLQRQYPDVFTVPIDDLLAWHLKDDEASIKQKHSHAALFAANFDCRDRPNDPHPFVARGRLFTVLGEWDKAEADLAKAWQLGGTGWVKSECRRLGRDALNEARQNEANRQSLEIALRKAEIAGTYLPPLGPHCWARLFARQRLRLPLDAKDQATLSWLLCGLPMAG